MIVFWHIFCHVGLISECNTKTVAHQYLPSPPYTDIQEFNLRKSICTEDHRLIKFHFLSILDVFPCCVKRQNYIQHCGEQFSFMSHFFRHV